jgi:hypothetical protein
MKLKKISNLLKSERRKKSKCQAMDQIQSHFHSSEPEAAALLLLISSSALLAILITNFSKHYAPVQVLLRISLKSIIRRARAQRERAPAVSYYFLSGGLSHGTSRDRKDETPPGG